ncbi:MAG: MgtC/SapB family protein [Dehalococcoidia bacterium]|jgi:putative Mg2+ transporter-C (MgtC) family protein|nr:MAG: MgtC/SapB family protein [Dehalococcoidia bacterium]
MQPELEMVLRLVMAMTLGALVGFERWHAGKPAGLRTNILISGGAALFTIVSIFAFDDPRMAAGVVTGIGFLGAGAIIRREEGGIGGLTTAASIWAVAAMGVAAGAGLYLISVVATVAIVFTLFFLRIVEEKVKTRPSQKENRPGEKP